MAHSAGKGRAARKALALTAQEQAWDKRADALVASFFEARADYQRLSVQCAHLKVDYTRLQAECAHLHLVVRAKQEVIEELLPYYPHPLPRAMQAKIYIS